MPMEPSRWNQADGTKPMEPSRWNQADGTKPMEPSRWKQADGSKPMEPSRWKQADGTKPMEPMQRNQTIVYKYPLMELGSINEVLFNKSIGANAEGKTLMFLHIPKTGGSTMGDVGLKHHIHWMWHLQPTLRRWTSSFASVRNCKRYSPWCPGHLCHVPLRWWTEDFMQNAPKQTNNTLQWYFDLNNTDWFAIVRNPFDKMVSEYKYRAVMHRARGLSGELWNCTVEHLNQWMGLHLGVIGSGLKVIPSYTEYIFGSTGKQIVKHVIRFENMKEELKKLFNEYNMDAVFRDWMHTHSNPSSCSNLQALMISENNKKIILAKYGEDFERFGYSTKI